MNFTCKMLYTFKNSKLDSIPVQVISTSWAFNVFAGLVETERTSNKLGFPWVYRLTVYIKQDRTPWWVKLFVEIINAVNFTMKTNEWGLWWLERMDAPGTCKFWTQNSQHTRGGLPTLVMFQIWGHFDLLLHIIGLSTCARIHTHTQTHIHVLSTCLSSSTLCFILVGKVQYP